MSRFKMTRKEFKTIGRLPGFGDEVEFYAESLGISKNELKLAILYVRDNNSTKVQYSSRLR